MIASKRMNWQGKNEFGTEPEVSQHWSRTLTLPLTEILPLVLAFAWLGICESEVPVHCCRSIYNASATDFINQVRCFSVLFLLLCLLHLSRLLPLATAQSLVRQVVRASNDFTLDPVLLGSLRSQAAKLVLDSR